MKNFHDFFCVIFALFICGLSYAGEINITVECGDDKILITSEKPILLSKLVNSLEKATSNRAVRFDTKIFKFAAFPVLCMKFHNKNAVENMWLCVGAQNWGEYEIEKDCTVVLLKTLKGFKIPKAQIWLFDEDSKEQIDD